MKTSPFVIDVSDLSAGARRPEHLEAPAEWAVDESRVEGPVRGDLVVELHSGGVMVTGTAEASFTHHCNRCLTPFSMAQRVVIAQEFSSDEGGDYLVVDDTVDTEPMLRDELLLAVPLVPLCREDCLGLCPECGADLNSRACSGHETESVSPFAELRSLFEQE